MKVYPAGGLVLIAGLFSILGIPPSGLFISELLIFKGLVFNSQWAVLIIIAVLLCCVIYAMSTRIMHIVFSDPRRDDLQEPGVVNPVETISQFVLLVIVIIMCFYQPPFLTELINQSIAGLPN
jgi:hydrogenase-4 component F